MPQWVSYVGALINSALYLVLVFVAGLAAHNHAVVNVDIAAIGVTYLSYTAQITGIMPQVSNALVFLSIGLGVIAGILLVF